MPISNVNGIDFYYEIHGEGEPVVFGNGIFSNTLGWVNQLPAFSKHHQVILYDMRGQGQSDKPDGEYTFEMHADDQMTLLENLGITKVHHVGISYGAELGLVFALKYPDAVRSLVACSAVSEINPLLRDMCLLWRYACEVEDAEMFYRATVPLNFAETFIREQTDILEKAKERYKTLDFPALVRLLDAFLMLDITNRLPEIRAPTCIIAGEQDILKPAYPYSQLIHDKIPDSEMTIIPDSGHAITFEQPDEFNSICLGFLRKK